LSVLEQLELDLIEYLLENPIRLHHRLTDLGFSGKDARKVYRRAEKTVLVCVMALRTAYSGLLDDQAGAPEPNPEPDDDSGSGSPP